MSICTRPEGCVCGGDTPAVRAGCGWLDKTATPPPEPTDEWWARRWLKSASDGERAAMRRLLA